MKQPFATIKTDNIQRVVKGLTDKIPNIDAILERKMNLIVDVVYTTARARRPKVGKASGGKRGAYRVSDPNAVVGVPVDTGALRESIKKKVEWKGGKISGTVSAGAGLNYAEMIEYGTSKMKPRPFMRPAYNENLEFIKKTFKDPSIK